MQTSKHAQSPLKKWIEKRALKNKGDDLEKRVQKILIREGKWNVKRNVILYDRFGNKSEIDVCHGFFFKRYYECKNYHDGHLVPLNDVAKFKSVLELNDIPVSRGTFITTSVYTPRCSSIGLKLIDGQQLKAWERRSYVLQLGILACKLGAVGLTAAVGYQVYQDTLKIDRARETIQLVYNKSKDFYNAWMHRIKTSFRPPPS